jgi:hypothetical protein
MWCWLRKGGTGGTRAAIKRTLAERIRKRSSITKVAIKSHQRDVERKMIKIENRKSKSARYNAFRKG